MYRTVTKKYFRFKQNHQILSLVIKILAARPQKAYFRSLETEVPRKDAQMNYPKCIYLNHAHIKQLLV